MSEAGERLIEGAKEALAIARGEQPAARIHVEGHAYVSQALVDEKLASVEDKLVRAIDALKNVESGTGNLVAKARNLVVLLDDAEVNHGGLLGQKTMRAIGELRLELQRWSE